MSEETLTERDRQLIRQTTAALRELYVEKIQAILADCDQEAASNGNLWQQGYIAGLQRAEHEIVGERVEAEFS